MAIRHTAHYTFVEIPIKCWANEDKGIPWLATRETMYHASGSVDHDRAKIRLIDEVQEWVWERRMQIVPMPSGYQYATLRFESGLTHALHFACKWL